MLSSSLFSLVLLLPAISGVRADDQYKPICESLLGVISTASEIFYPLTTEYQNGIYHWASSSTQQSACVVEPGTADDVASILGVLASTKTPFAVKGGGHASNPGFSSTPGVHIYMGRFNSITYDDGSGTASFGTGLIWDDVYAGLEPFGVSVVGGRVSGVGVAGFTLGGGYSWKTNQHGLTVDTVQAFELVLPTGQIVDVTANSYPDLFFGLKGGGNNFGIVTKLTLLAYKQTEIWGGPIYYTADQFGALSAAVAAFAANVTDPKAVILPTYNSLSGTPGATNLMFYDGPNPPAGIFDDFLAIPHIGSDVSTRSYSSMITAAPSNATGNTRTFFHTLPVKTWSSNILAAVVNETTFWGPKLALSSGTFASYDVEPFLSTLFTHSTSSSAYPPDSARDPSVATLPLNIYYAWSSELSDQQFYDAIYASANHLKSIIAAEQGDSVTSSPIYNNYAMYDTPLESLYGENVPTLQALAQKYDPEGVMKLAGGFKF